MSQTQVNAQQLLQDWLIDLGAEGKDVLDSITPEEKQLAVDVLSDIAGLRMRELRGQDVTAHLGLAESSLLDLKAAATQKWARAVNSVLENSKQMAGSIITGLLGKIFG